MSRSAGSDASPHIATSCHPSVRLKQISNLITIAGDKCRRPICRTVIGDNDLQWPVGLLQDAFKSLGEITFAVKYGNDAAYERLSHNYVVLNALTLP